LNIVVYNIVPKPEDNYFLPVSSIIFPEATIDIDKKRTQSIANYIKPTKSSKPKRDNINQLVKSLEKLSITTITQEDL
jgi:cytochrome c oxidase assembly protein Cox11